MNICTSCNKEHLTDYSRLVPLEAIPIGGLFRFPLEKKEEGKVSVIYKKIGKVGGESSQNQKMLVYLVE